MKKLVATLAIAVLSSLPSWGAPESPRPNIVLFIADDLSRMEMSCYGGGNARTPHLDRLASQGLRFEKCYNSVSTCAPTRALLYTGLYPVRNGSHRNHSTSRPDIQSLPHYLQALGYRVGIAGKRHIGPPETFPFDLIGKRGLFPAGRQVGSTPDDLNHLRQFITRDASQPFCMVICSTFPHPPWRNGTTNYPPERLKLPPYWVDTPEIRQLYAGYCTDVERLDTQAGAVLGLLDETGVADKTLFIFLSEQGTDLPWAKWTCYEQGLHAGALVRWPGVIKAGTVSQAMVEYVDVLPTLVDAAGGPPIPDLDGRSFLPVLLGKTDTHKKVAFGLHNNQPDGNAYPSRCVRTSRFSYIRNLAPENEYWLRPVMGEGRRNWHDFWPSWLEKAKTDPAAARLVDRYIHRPAEELYDLEADPWEQNNLASDPAHEATKRELARQLDDWMRQQGDTGADMDKPVEQKGPWL